MKGQTAFVTSEELTSKIKKLQKELNLSSPGEVVALGLSLVNLAMGREVEFADKDKSFRTRHFSKYNQTVNLTDDGTDQSAK